LTDAWPKKILFISSQDIVASNEGFTNGLSETDTNDPEKSRFFYFKVDFGLIPKLFFIERLMVKR
jgi:hypothetical protein